MPQSLLGVLRGQRQWQDGMHASITLRGVEGSAAVAARGMHQRPPETATDFFMDCPAYSSPRSLLLRGEESQMHMPTAAAATETWRMNMANKRHGVRTMFGTVGALVKPPSQGQWGTPYDVTTCGWNGSCWMMLCRNCGGIRGVTICMFTYIASGGGPL